MEGIVNVSDGRAFNWYADGKFTMSLKNNLDLSVGSFNEVSVGLKSDFWLGHHSSMSLGTSVDVSKGPSFSLSESSSGSKERDDDHYMVSYAKTIGADPIQIKAMSRLRAAAWILMTAQTGLMISSATAAAIRSKFDEKKADLGYPAIGVTVTILPQIANIGIALTAAIMACKQKWGNLKDMGEPAGVLSMDKDGGVFLGTRKAAADATYSSGVLINETGVQISAAKADLAYAKPGDSSSILGFSAAADSHDGARMEISHDGGTRIYGTGMHTALKKPGGTAVHTTLAQEHYLKVTGAGNLTPTESSIGLTDTGALIQRDNDTAFSVQDGSINAVIGGAQGSVMRLTKNESSIGTDSNRLTIDNQGIHLSVGNSHFKLDPTGASIGGILTIMMGPYAPAQFGGLQEAIADVQALRTAMNTGSGAAQQAQDNFNTSRNLTNTSNTATITARDKPFSLLEKLKWKS